MARIPEYKRRYCLERIGGEEGLRRLRELYESAVPIETIKRELGLSSPDCIYVLLGRPRRRGPYRGRARITPEVREKVLKMREEGLSIYRIARELGISVGSVHRIIRESQKSG